LKDQLAEYLNTNNKTFLYISHEHQDHFDKETLTEIQPSIDLCIIPDYKDKFLHNELLNMGYKVQELCDQTKHHLNQTDYIELMIVDTGVNHDSAAIFKIDGETFFNQNDCKIFDRLTYLKDEAIDYYAIQFSGTTWPLVCYELSETASVRLTKQN
jgi:UDP-MurNAc hydroxylase